MGFEPTSRLRDYLISSQGRYDHFDIFPYYLRHKIPCANFLSIISYFVRFVNCFVAVFHFSHCFLRGGVLKSFSDKARNQRITKSIGLAFVIANYLKGFFCFPIQNMLYSDEYQFTVFRDLHLFKPEISFRLPLSRFYKTIFFPRNCI